MKTSAARICKLTVIVAGITTGLSAVAAPLVSTKDGQLQGKTEKGLVEFFGIRFAQPPTGNLRWRAPIPLEPWTGVQLATEFGPACAQLPLKAEANTILYQSSEDCLTLNIWLPDGLTPASKLPVLVNIFGGGFVGGSPSVPRSDLSAWARQGVIAVGINYRLGDLGWFAFPELTREQGPEGTGNFGLMDQAAALRWIKNNIQAFGGDPDKITVTGSSAGAISVNMLMVAPLARGLFAQAATISGFGRQPSKSLAAAEAEGTRFAQKLEVTSLAELRALPIARILSVAPQTAGDPLADNSVGPILDGVCLPKDIFPSFMAGEEAKVPWLVGSASFDASNAYRSLPNPTTTVYREESPAEKAEALKLFNPEKTLKADRVAQEVLTARIATEPARELARSHAGHGLPTFQYYFGYVATGLRSSEWGAIHGEQNAFFQNNFASLEALIGRSYQPSAADKRMAVSMTEYITTFAKTGQPYSSSNAHWEKDAHNDTLDIENNQIRMKAEFAKQRLDFVEHVAEQHPLP